MHYLSVSLGDLVSKQMYMEHICARHCFRLCVLLSSNKMTEDLVVMELSHHREGTDEKRTNK